MKSDPPPTPPRGTLSYAVNDLLFGIPWRIKHALSEERLAPDTRSLLEKIDEATERELRARGRESR
jgi:hypothetical protein